MARAGGRKPDDRRQRDPVPRCTQLELHGSPGERDHQRHRQADVDVAHVAEFNSRSLEDGYVRESTEASNTGAYAYVTTFERYGFEPVETDLATTARVADLGPEHPFHEGLTSSEERASHVDVRDALVSLGLTPQEASEAVRDVDADGRDVDDMLREALQKVGR